MPDDKQEGAYWLPEVVVLRLNALEAGALMVILLAAREGTDVKDFPIQKPGPDGKPVPTMMMIRLLEKLNKEIQQFYPDSQEKKP